MYIFLFLTKIVNVIVHTGNAHQWIGYEMSSVVILFFIHLFVNIDLSTIELGRWKRFSNVIIWYFAIYKMLVKNIFYEIRLWRKLTISSAFYNVFSYFFESFSVQSRVYTLIEEMQVYSIFSIRLGTLKSFSIHQSLFSRMHYYSDFSWSTIHNR